MLNDEQHEKLKKLLRIALDKSQLYDWHQIDFSLNDIADIIDPEHWTHGVYMKTRRHVRLSDEELMMLLSQTISANLSRAALNGEA